MGSASDADAAGDPAVRRVRFGTFEADLRTGELWRDGEPVPLQDLPFRVLAALAERPGEVISRAELTARLWGPDTFVDAAAGLNTAVAKLREALGDDADRPAFVETLPKRGYRFVARVEPAMPIEAAAGEASVEGPAPTPTAGPRSPSAAPPTSRRHRILALAAVGALALIVAAAGAYRAFTMDHDVRVAVVLFDNETGRPEYAQFAQAMTDATVAALTAERRFAVIGNAAVLRTARPFRDIATVRDALAADYVVIGQVQLRDGDVLVRTHLVRGRDQAHVGIDEAVRGGAGEAAFQARVSGRVRLMLLEHLTRASAR